MLMMDCASNVGTLEIWTSTTNASLADIYMGNSITNAIFDLVRHRGKLNVLYADGHVDTHPILSSGASVANGPVGSAGNTPSGYVAGQQSYGGGGLAGISVCKDFPQN